MRIVAGIDRIALLLQVRSKSGHRANEPDGHVAGQRSAIENAWHIQRGSE